MKKRHYQTWSKFIDLMARKIIVISHDKLMEIIKKNKYKLPRVNKKSLQYLNWYHIDSNNAALIEKTFKY